MSFFRTDDLPAKEIVPGAIARTLHTGHMSFVYWQADAGADFPMHQHPHQQVAHVLEGTFELTVGTETKVLQPGIVAVVPGGVLHGGRALTNCLLLDVFCPEREDYKFA